METVVFGGVSYEKASDVAAQFNYTSDYIGQLCRGKKVDARLIGRAWYVNPESVKSYRKQKHHKRQSRKDEKKLEKTLVSSEKSKLKIKPREHRIVENARKAPHVSSEKARATRTLKVNYEPDEYELLPSLKQSNGRTVSTFGDKNNTHVTSAKMDTKFSDLPKEPAVTIKVKTKSKARGTTLVAEPLPEVSLAGAVAVVAAPPGPHPVIESDDAESVAEKTVTKASKLKRLLLFFLSPILLPFKLLRWLFRPIYRLGNWIIDLFLKIPLQSIVKSLFKKSRTPVQDSPRVVDFAPNSSVADRSHSELYDYVRFWSIIVSALLTSLLLLSIGFELSVNGSDVARTVYVDRDIVCQFFGLCE